MKLKMNMRTVSNASSQQAVNTTGETAIARLEGSTPVAMGETAVAQPGAVPAAAAAGEKPKRGRKPASRVTPPSP